MARSIGQRPVLGVVLAVLLVAVGYRAWNPPGRVASAPGRTASRSVAENPARANPPAVPDVQLGVLESARPDPASPGRNLFRFDAGRPGVAPEMPAIGPAPVGPGPGPVPAGGGRVASLALGLKFIGTLDVLTDLGTVAVLSDGQFVFHGREGDVIDGRYRIVSIGAESLVMEHLDGGGRQTLRLSGL